MTFLPFPHWVGALEDSDRSAVEGYARENPVFCHNLDVAQAVQLLRPVLVDEAGHWALGQVLRAILEDEQDYWRWVANPRGRIGALRAGGDGNAHGRGRRAHA